MTVMEYAQMILKESHCDEYAYSNHDGELIMRHLKKAYPEGMEFPYVDVANAILLMSRPLLVERKPYCAIWNTDSCCDGVQCDSLEDAQSAVVNFYETWMDSSCALSDDDWNDMIEECYAYVAKYNAKTDEYEEHCYLPDEDLESMGWKMRN